ncbi:stAR-related lipid transfer protein 3 isoform X4 [Hydra vulgaris]|uniref:StAR-related lipid transfer protein 3 isoform X4 n=1 Tax=Hydra vulgaris TaxID=6087 RepID=A0ABM4CYK9_HYDVU
MEGIDMAEQNLSNGSLNTLQDAGAQEYIQKNLFTNDFEPLITANDNKSENCTSKGFSNDLKHQGVPLHTISLLNGRFKMTPVRRMFCLLVLFDCLMTFLMWVIFLQVDGGFSKNVVKEVVRYQFTSSYFDVVAISFGRSALLLLAYACIFKSQKWYMIAIMTASSTIFLLVKVFKIAKINEGAPMSYLLIIYSFVICWCEAWHFDYQVIPKETHKKTGLEVLPNVIAGSYSGKAYLKSFPQGPHSAAYFTPHAQSIYRARTISDGSQSSSVSNLSQELQNAQEMDRSWISKGNDNVHEVLKIFFINEEWHLEQKETDNISVYTRYFKGIGKVFKMETRLDVSSNILDKLFWDDVENHSIWNSSVKECQVFHRVNKNTDILYTVSSEAAGGVIANRDFVVLRRRKKKGPITLLCSVSIETDLLPTKSGIIRGHNGPGGFILRDIPNEPGKTELFWLLNTDIKGWLPSRLVEQSLSGVMVNTVRDIRRYLMNMPSS